MRHVAGVRLEQVGPQHEPLACGGGLLQAGDHAGDDARRRRILVGFRDGSGAIVRPFLEGLADAAVVGEIEVREDRRWAPGPPPSDPRRRCGSRAARPGSSRPACPISPRRVAAGQDGGERSRRVRGLRPHPPEVRPALRQRVQVRRQRLAARGRPYPATPRRSPRSASMVMIRMLPLNLRSGGRLAARRGRRRALPATSASPAGSASRSGGRPRQRPWRRRPRSSRRCRCRACPRRPDRRSGRWSSQSPPPKRAENPSPSPSVTVRAMRSPRRRPSPPSSTACSAGSPRGQAAADEQAGEHDQHRHHRQRGRGNTRGQATPGRGAVPEDSVRHPGDDRQPQRHERGQIQHAPVGARERGHRRQHAADGRQRQQQARGAGRRRPRQPRRQPAAKRAPPARWPARHRTAPAAAPARRRRWSPARSLCIGRTTTLWPTATAMATASRPTAPASRPEATVRSRRWFSGAAPTRPAAPPGMARSTPPTKKPKTTAAASPAMPYKPRERARTATGDDGAGARATVTAASTTPAPRNPAKIEAGTGPKRQWRVISLAGTTPHGCLAKLPPLPPAPTGAPAGDAATILTDGRRAR